MVLSPPRNLAVWKRLRNEIAEYIPKHTLDERLQPSFQACGELEPKAAYVAVSSALVEASEEAKSMPQDVVDAVRWVIGLRDEQRYIAERLARHIG